jgi:hypothetical protein
MHQHIHQTAGSMIQSNRDSATITQAEENRIIRTVWIESKLWHKEAKHDPDKASVRRHHYCRNAVEIENKQQHDRMNDHYQGVESHPHAQTRDYDHSHLSSVQALLHQTLLQHRAFEHQQQVQREVSRGVERGVELSL